MQPTHNMQVTYGQGFGFAKSMRSRVETLQETLRTMPQYEPATKHYFHAGMYCREVFREAGVLIIGKVHKQEHFYIIASGTVMVTTDDGVEYLTGPSVVMSKPGTKRAVCAITDTTCMTFHITTAKTPQDAEMELVEQDSNAMLDFDNKVKKEVLQ